MRTKSAIGCMLLALVLSLALTSCVHTPGGPTASLAPAPATARQGLEDRRLAVTSFAMSGEIELSAPQGELNGDHLILGLAPDRLRAEVLGPFGQPLLRVVIDGRRMSVLAYRENRAYVGPASRANLARFLGLSLSPAEVFAVLTGAPPLLPPPVRAEVTPVEQSGMALLRLVEPGGQAVQGLIFDPTDFAVSRAWLEGPGGKASLEMSFGLMQKALGSRYPRRLKAADGQGRSLLLTNSQLKLNQSPDPALFEVSVPPGLEVVKLP
jgi:outer membrane lipoprotein-sorting protein